MSGQGNDRPNELVFHAPVTLRRFRAEDNDALYRAVTESLDHLRPRLPWAQDYPLDPPAPGGTGIGVVWRLTRPPSHPVT
jgi:hypothetical protein